MIVVAVSAIAIYCACTGLHGTALVILQPDKQKRYAKVVLHLILTLVLTDAALVSIHHDGLHLPSGGFDQDIRCLVL